MFEAGRRTALRPAGETVRLDPMYAAPGPPRARVRQSAELSSDVSEAQRFICLHHQLCEPFRIDELRVFAFQVRIQDPTGLRAAASYVDPDIVRYCELKQFLQGRHSDAGHAFPNGVFD